jgi:predicted DNA-binding transcriptional regulator YafY
MNDQAKIQRTLRLLMLLAGKRWYNAPEIQERLGISTRTLYRYLHTLELAGFVTERNPRQGYRLAPESGSMLTMQQLLHFTEEEGYLLYKTLGLLQGEGMAKERLLRKLHTLYDCHILAQPARQHSMEIVATLQKAINKKHQCTLHQYRSNHSQTITDRTIEPFAFTENYESIWGYDADVKSCRQYKLARMEKVVISPHSWTNEKMHAIPFTDAFGFAAAKPLGTAQLTLSMRAANLLREEYPLAEKYITEHNNAYHAKIPFADYKGIARFIRGLCDEIEVLGPVGLKKYVGHQTT